MGKIGQGKYYPFLDGLRAFAVLWVIFRHLNYELNLNFIFGDYYVFFDRLGYLGFLGVDIFFVISGSHVYLKTLSVDVAIFGDVVPEPNSSPFGVISIILDTSTGVASTAYTAIVLPF